MHTPLPFSYRVWCVDEGSFFLRPAVMTVHRDFQGPRSWQSHFLCNFMVVFLNEDIGCSEARGQSLPAPFSGLFRSMFPFTWWKVIHHLHPWILPLFPFFFSSLPPPPLAVLSLSLQSQLSSSPWYLWRCWEIDRFNATACQPSRRTG